MTALSCETAVAAPAGVESGPACVAVVSLRFSPAHASHLLAYGRLLRQSGREVCFIMDRDYLRFGAFEEIGQCATPEEYEHDPRRIPMQAAIFYNAAMRNPLFARRMRRRGVRVLYVFHEPVPLTQRLSEGWKEIVKLAFAKLSSLLMLHQSDGVLVASHHAEQMYTRYYARHNAHVSRIPLLFDDELAEDAPELTCAERRYFSFLGLALKAHDFDGFVAFAKAAIGEGTGIEFLIATRTDLGAMLASDNEFARYVAEGKIRLQHGRMLTNDEMNRFTRESFCLWNVYTCSTQSGALVRAFMNGTPVVARPIGSFPEFVLPGLTGEFVESSADTSGLLQAALKIRKNIAHYSAGARDLFREHFYYPANRQRLEKILASLRKDPEA